MAREGLAQIGEGAAAGETIGAQAAIMDDFEILQDLAAPLVHQAAGIEQAGLGIGRPQILEGGDLRVAIAHDAGVGIAAEAGARLAVVPPLKRILRGTNAPPQEPGDGVLALLFGTASGRAVKLHREHRAEIGAKIDAGAHGRDVERGIVGDLGPAAGGRAEKGEELLAGLAQARGRSARGTTLDGLKPKGPQRAGRRGAEELTHGHLSQHGSAPILRLPQSGHSSNDENRCACAFTSAHTRRRGRLSTRSEADAGKSGQLRATKGKSGQLRASRGN